MRTTRNDDFALVGPGKFTGPRAAGTGANPGLVPDFALNLINEALPAAVSFSRASNATQFDRLGRLVWAPHQLCTRGSNLGAVAWTMTEGTVALSGNLSPVNEPSWNVVFTAGAPTSGLSIPSQIVTVGANHTVSVYLRRLNHQWIRFGMFSGSTSTNQVRCWVDMVNLQLGTVQAQGAATVVGGNITLLPNGWVRVSVTGNCQWSASTDNNILIATALADLSTTRVGNGAGVEAAAVLSEVASPASPTPWRAEYATAGSAWYGPRFDYNPQTFAALGLLFEPAATNLNPFFQPTAANWTANFSTVTDTGATIAGNPALTYTTTAASSFVFPTNGTTTHAASLLHTAQIRVKRGNHPRVQFTVSNNAFLPTVADAYCNYNFDTDTLVVGGSSLPAPTATRSLYADGSVLLTLTYTSGTAPTAGTCGIVCLIDSDVATRLSSTATVGATVHMFGIQAETGSIATSLIPTYGTTLSRSADVCDMLPDCPWNPAGMTMYTAFSRYAFPASGGTNICWFGNATDYWSFSFGSGTPAQARLDMVVASVPEAQVSQGLTTVGAVEKQAARIAPNDTRLSRNGSVGTADLTVTMLPTLPNTRKSIGRGNSISTLQFYGHLRELRIYTQALSDATLNALTA